MHAHAAPPCANWVLNSPVLLMNLSNGQRASFDWNQDLKTQPRNGMNANAKLEAPNGDSWDGYASLMIQGDMIAGPVSWHPRQLSFDKDASQNQIINSDFRGNIVDLGSARDPRMTTRAQPWTGSGRQSSTAQTAHRTQGTHGSVGLQLER